jgi:DNA-binding response OmpR family regulator
MSTVPIPGTAVSGPAEAPLVLVVDDIAENRSVVCRRLERMGYRYFAVDGGRAAIAALDTHQPDLMLLDYMMPDMSGLDVLQELRDRSGHADLPVIMLTARTDPEMVVSALNAGANDYVTKPIDFVVLQARMEKQLQRGEESRQLRDVNAVLDSRVSVRAVENEELREQLTEITSQRKQLEAELQSLRTVSPATGDDMAAAVYAAPSAAAIAAAMTSLRRLDTLATRLTTAPPGTIPNLATITEMAALARAALDELSGKRPQD